MKLYAITIEILGGLGTPLKGDTLFGHFCWRVAYQPSLLNGGLEKWLPCYHESPFAVFSSAFPTWTSDQGAVLYGLKRPDLALGSMLPLDRLDRAQRIRRRKEFKNKRWMVTGEALAVNLREMEYLDDTELLGRFLQSSRDRTKRGYGATDTGLIAKTFSQPHNTINRLTGTTGSGEFAPYEQESLHYYPGLNLAAFVLVNEDATDIDRVCSGLEHIGTAGFGRDASIGLGRFRLIGVRELERPAFPDANACYCLSPCVPEQDSFSQAYFMPFCRFGKHGDRLAVSAHPFKKPIIMADEGAVFLPKDVKTFLQPYIGRSVAGISRVQLDAVAQGYSVYLPLKVEL